MKALIVDDSRVLRLHMGKMMQEMGWKTAEAENGSLALDMLREDGDFTLALMDVNMPEMDGLECVRRLRTEMKDHTVKVMMVTTIADGNVIADVLDDGADEFLMKPFTPENLRAKLQILSISPVA
jgi:two-component system chemotaxis response regulator CheY